MNRVPVCGTPNSRRRTALSLGISLQLPNESFPQYPSPSPSPCEYLPLLWIFKLHDIIAVNTFRQLHQPDDCNDISSPGVQPRQPHQHFLDNQKRKPYLVRHFTTVRDHEIGTGISEASKRVPIFSFATQGGKQASSYFRQMNLVQAREAGTRLPAG